MGEPSPAATPGNKTVDAKGESWEGLTGGNSGDRGVAVSKSPPSRRRAPGGALDALAHSETRYRRLFEAARDGILLLDVETGRITDANPFMYELLGYSHDELLGKELWEIGLFADQAASQAAFRQLQEVGYIRYEDLPLQTRRGERREVEFISNVYAEGNGNVIQCNIRDITERVRLEQERQRAHDELQTVRDKLQVALEREQHLTKALRQEIQERRALEERLAHQAFHDAVTGLPNRAFFLDHLERAIAHAKRSGTLVCVMFLDLDGFKAVNDTRGHEFGDRLLAAVAARLLASVRPEDVVARWGGDEFTLLLQDVQEESHVRRMVGRLEQCLAMPITVAGHEIAVRASMGVVMGNGSSTMRTPGDFLRAADQAMYHAKMNRAVSSSSSGNGNGKDAGGQQEEVK